MSKECKKLSSNVDSKERIVRLSRYPLFFMVCVRRIEIIALNSGQLDCGVKMMEIDLYLFTGKYGCSSFLNMFSILQLFPHHPRGFRIAEDVAQLAHYHMLCPGSFDDL